MEDNVSGPPVEFEPFEALISRHEGELRRYIARSSPPADVDDLCQETFLRAHRAYGRLDGQAGGAPRAWLYRIAANVCIDHARGLRRRPVDELKDVASSADGPEALAEANETVEHLRSLVARLPRRQRDALVLRRLKGLEYREVADRMGGSEATARANVYQAIRRLRDWLAQGRVAEDLQS